MSRTYQILLALVVAVLAGGGYWKLALNPKRVQAAELEERVSVAQAELAQQQALVNTYRGAQKDYRANYETVVRLGKAIPTDDDTRSLLVQLDTAAKRAGADFDAINVNGSGSTDSATTGATGPVTPGAVNAGAFSAMPFTFGFTGTFEDLNDFFARLERFVTLKGDAIAVNGRLIRIENLNLQAAEDGWPGMQATVGASAYLVPETTDPATAASATPATETSTTTTTTTSSSSSGEADAR